MAHIFSTDFCKAILLRKLTKLKLALVAAALSFALTPASAYNFTADGIYYNFVSFSNSTCAVTSGDQLYEGDVTVPSTVTYRNDTLTVVSIGNLAFSECTELTNINIPSTVTSIGEWAFSDCYGLTSITIPNSVTSIGDYAFEDCSGLTSITIPNSVTSIGNYAFADCPSLISIRVDSDNQVYDSREDCNAIIETATNKLIQGCSTTNIPNTVTSIGYHAFSDCSSLKSITIPNSVTSIGEGAFWYCDSLTSLVIGNSVSTIGRDAFDGCYELKSITSLNPTPPVLDEKSFWDYSATLYVPQEAIEAYKAADYWKKFHIEAVETTGMESVEADSGSEPAAIYDLQGRKLDCLHRGINIVGGKKVLVK